MGSRNTTPIVIQLLINNKSVFNINEELGPGGAQIFDPTSKAKTTNSGFVIKTAKKR